MKIKSVVVLLGLLAIVIGGIYLMRRQSAQAAPSAPEAGPEKKQEAAIQVPGLQTLRVRATIVSSSLALTGEVEADADLTARVGSPVSGRLVTLRAKVGDQVRAGQSLATVASRDVAEVNAALTRARAEAQAAAGRLQSVRALAAVGALTAKPLEEAKTQHTAAVAAVRQAEAAVSAAESARASAARELERVKQLAASQAYQARPVEDAKRDVAEAQAELDTARAQIKVRQAAYDRSKRLSDVGLASKREVESAEADLGEARAKETEAATHLQIAKQALSREESISKQDLYSLGEVRQAQATLRAAEREVEHEAAELERTRGHLQVATSSLAREQKIAGGNLLARKEVQEAASALTVARAQVEAAQQGMAALRLTTGARGSASIGIVAPISGIITERQATPMQAVEATTDLFTIVNTNRVWVWGEAHEKDLAKVGKGQLAEVRVNSYPGRPFYGRVGLIGAGLDPKSRTARVRCVVPNPAGLLRPGMFASVSLQTSGSHSTILVPKDAVLDDTGKKIVFIACGDCEEDIKAGKSVCGKFDKTDVEVGSLRGDRIEVTKGIPAGAEVVIKGQYQLKTALGSGQLDAGCTD